MNVQYLIDEKTGKKTGVFLGIDEYIELLEKVEDSEALKMLHKLRKKPLKTKKFDAFLNENSDNV